MDYKLYLDIAIILFSTKFLGIVLKRIGLPEVVGAILAGFILGPTLLGVVKGGDFLQGLAEIGVVLIMFTAGMETNIKQIKETGKASFYITILGVIVPIGMGFVLACLFNGGFNAPADQLLNNLFIGVVLTATSVSITVATLKEMGKMSGKIGTSIVSAAILDDIIGLIILSFMISVKDVGVNPLTVLLNTFLFFIFAIVFGFIMHMFFIYLSKKYPHNRRMSIFSLGFCFLMVFIAENIFQISDITGAFIAGIVISNIKTTKYIESRIDISAYMLFAPIFFASIGINSVFGAFDVNLLLFGILFIIVGIFSKIIGCGIGAKISGYPIIPSLFVGIGMMPRAEVMLIAVQKGIDKGFMDYAFMPYILGLVIISSLIAPILLKLTNKYKEIEPLLENNKNTT